jgi:hypothetical protein
VRRRYRQDPKTREWVEFTTARKRVAAPDILPDIEPYDSIITGEKITSRSHHREHLAKHECEEVGSEIPQFLRDKYERDGDRPEWSRSGRRVIHK